MKQLVVGLMCGTSLDGIDAALVEIDASSDNVSFALRGTSFTPFDKDTRARLVQVLPPNKGTVDELAYLHFYLGEILADAVRQVASECKVLLSDIDLIGTHGVTIRNLQSRGQGFPHSRLQIGDISVIAIKTGITTVGDFRPADVAAGGEGAPLIPYFDYYAFRSSASNRVILNLGGIANVTYIPAGAELADVRGFDTGPANMILDSLIRKLTEGRECFDRDGLWAARGHVHPGLLSSLMDHPFVRKEPPKSAGREEFGESFLRDVIQKAAEYGLSNDDLVTTITGFTVEAITYNCEQFLGPVDEVIVGGGGAFNLTILRMLRERFPEVRVVTTDEYGIPAKAREAMGFALLAYQTLRQTPNNVPSVTGAQRPVVMGKIAWGGIGRRE